MGIRSQMLPRFVRGVALGMAALGVLMAARPAASATAPQAVDSLSRALPGSVAGANLLRGLRTPTAERRWNALRVFGAGLFEAGAGGWTPAEGGLVGPDYTLGPGDQLQVFVSSLADTSYTLVLDREGKVFLPRVGSTYLWSLRFEEAEKLVRGRLASVYRNARVQVSMGRLRTLDVFVLGNAVRPGKLTLSGAATAFHALAAAGGPSALGSLRDIRVMRGEKRVGQLDLYPMLTNGDRKGDPRLENGDVVFVGLAAGRVGIQGEVVRPAIYEMSGRFSLRDLLSLAGGPTAYADLARVRIERVEPGGGFRVEDVELDHGHGADPDTLMLHDQDLVTVLERTDRMQNVVTLDGYVRHAGEYELTPGLRLSQLLQRDRLLPEADLDHAEFRRVDPATLRAEVRSFSPKRLWEGKQDDWALQPLDAVTVFSSARLPAAVVLQGEVQRPGSYAITPGERLSSVLARAGGATPAGSLRAAVFRRPGSRAYLRALKRELDQRHSAELDRQRLAVAGDSAALQALLAQQHLLDRQEADADVDRVVLELDEKGRWRGGIRDLVLEDGDHFYVPPRPTTVTVLGNVMNPGTLAAKRSASPNEYIRRAGGFARDADRERSYVLRASGSAVPLRRVALVEPGDAIVVAPKDVATRSVGRDLAGVTQYLLQAAAAAAVVVAAVKR